MDLWFSILPELLTAMFVLGLGILLVRQPGQNLGGVAVEVAIWAGALFLAISVKAWFIFNS